VTKFKSIALCALMIAALTLGGALAAAQFQQDEEIISVVSPNDILPIVIGQT